MNKSQLIDIFRKAREILMQPPMIFNQDILTKNLFEYMPDHQLVIQVFQPINKNSRRLATIELFCRTSGVAQHFQLAYLDFIFHHHEKISRAEFIDILKKSGILITPFKALDPIPSLLIGAVFENNLFSTNQLLAYSLADLEWRSLTPAPRPSHLKAINSLISIYCLASSDRVRHYIFNQLATDMYFSRTSSAMSCEVLAYLTPFLIKPHLNRVIKAFENSYEIFHKEKDGIGVSAQNTSILGMMNAQIIRGQYFSKRKRIQLKEMLLEKQVNQNLPVRLVNPVMMNLLKLTKRHIKLPQHDAYENYQLRMNIRQGSLAIYNDAEHYVFQTYFPLSNESCMTMPSLLAKIKTLLHLDLSPLENGIELIVAANEYFCDSARSLTKEQSVAIYEFVAPELNLYAFNGTTSTVANLLALLLHEKIPQLTMNDKYRCLSNCFIIFNSRHSQQFLNDALTLDVFHQAFLKLAEKIEGVYLEVDMITRASKFFVEDILKSRVLYKPAINKIISHLPREYQEKMLAEILGTINGAFNAESIPNIVFLIACVFKPRDNKSIQTLFKALRGLLNSEPEQFHLMNNAESLVPMIHLFSNLNEEQLGVVKLDKEKMLDHLIKAAINRDKFDILAKFIITEKPKLTPHQTKIILVAYGEKLKSSRSRTLFKYLDTENCPSLIAALASNLTPMHTLWLRRIRQDSEIKLHQILVKASDFKKWHSNELPELPEELKIELTTQLRAAIAGSNGYVSRMKSGIFQGQPTAPFREMLRLVDAIDERTRPMSDSLTELQSIALKLNAQKVLNVINEFGYIEAQDYTPPERCSDQKR